MKFLKKISDNNYSTIPESLHFLIVNGRKQKAAKWIRNAEKYGKVLHKRNVDMMVELLENTCSDVKVHESKEERMTENLRFNNSFAYFNRGRNRL